MDAGEQAGEPFVRVRTGGPVTYLSWWTFSKPETLRPGERQALENRVRLQVDPANVKELGIFREPVLSRDAMYSLALRASTRRAVTGWRGAVCRSRRTTRKSLPATSHARSRATATYQGGWGNPHRLVQWPGARFDQAWSMPSELKVHIKAGPRLYAGAPGTVAAVDIPPLAANRA